MPGAARPASRGPYAKGVVRRTGIVDAALEALAVNGLQNSWLDEVARRVGISRQGLLHYFSSKEDLIIAVLQERDVRDVAAGLGDNETRPGSAEDVLVQRRSIAPKRLPGSPASTPPSRPLPPIPRTRRTASSASVTRTIRETTRRGLEYMIREGRLDPALDTESASQQILGILDGLQRLPVVARPRPRHPRGTAARPFELSSRHRLQP